MATEMVKENTPRTAGYVDRGANYQRKQEKLKQEEEELQRLMEAQGKEQEDVVEEPSIDEEEEDVEIETPADKKKRKEKEDTKQEDESDEELSAEEKSFKKRYGDLRRHSQKKQEELTKRIEELESKLKDGPQSVRPPKSDEDIEAWARKYPDVASIVETIAEKKAAERFKDAESRLKELDSAREEATRTKAENSIRKAHPDFDTLRDSDEFHNWAEEQPKWVQDALYENMDDPASVVRVIDLYKVDNKIDLGERKSKAKEAAKAVSKGKPTKIDTEEVLFKESDVKKMSDKEFEESYEQIQKAMAEGKFVYDLSQRR
ncbi:MAG: hypothetical protein GWN31_14430 [Candidatus Thorarchaeota archaeon]|nr:hypothetical protein [Candidatus Thorarchaeota archaeon]NIW15090.1 hypothetical protein [Candidatus Thorarchaeota archaeon]